MRARDGPSHRRPGRRARAARCRCRRGAAARDAAAAGRGSAPSRPSPGPCSIPCRGRPRSAASPARAGWTSRRPRSRGAAARRRCGAPRPRANPPRPRDPHAPPPRRRRAPNGARCARSSANRMPDGRRRTRSGACRARASTTDRSSRAGRRSARTRPPRHPAPSWTWRRARRTPAVRSATSTRSMKRIRSSHAASGCRVGAFDDEPRRLSVVDDVHDVLDVSGCVEEERFGRFARREPIERLARHGVQPAEPVGARDREHAAVREIDDRIAALELALLDDGVAVVARDAGVDALRGHGAVEGEERGAGHQSTFASRAEAWVLRSWPRAAMSQAHRRWPSTSP